MNNQETAKAECKSCRQKNVVIRTCCVQHLHYFGNTMKRFLDRKIGNNNISVFLLIACQASKWW